MNPRAARFTQHTLQKASDGHAFGWIVHCACGDSKTVGCNKWSLLPPDAVIKKFTQAGWRIGKRAKDDVCPRCDAAARTKTKRSDDDRTTSERHAAALVEAVRLTKQSFAARGGQRELVDVVEAMCGCLQAIFDGRDRLAPHHRVEVHRVMDALAMEVITAPKPDAEDEPPAELPAAEHQEQPPPESELVRWLETLAQKGEAQ